MRIASQVLIAFCLVTLAQLIWSTRGTAQEDRLRTAVELLAAGTYSKTIAGVDEIAASGMGHAPAILDALSKRRVYLAEEGSAAAYRAGKTYFNFVTAAPLEGRPAGYESVRVNNRVRGAIKAALGTLQLRAKDPDKRIAAAEEIFRTKDVSVLEALGSLIAKEKDAAVRRAFVDARAALILADGTAGKADQLAAIDVLRARGTRDAAIALGPAEKATDADVVKAARSAIAEIERWLVVSANMQNVWYGLSLGSVLLLAAIGLAITFGVMGVINMAHGELIMLGAYTTYVIQLWLPNHIEYSLFIAIPAAFLVSGATGILIERGVIRFLYGRPLETLLATFGISLILQQLVRSVFSPLNRSVESPSWMSGSWQVNEVLSLTLNRMYIILFCLLVFGLLFYILKRSRLGLQVRAVSQNRPMARSMGVRSEWVDAMTFGLGSGIAGIAGVALSQLTNVGPNMGQSYIIDSFMVVVFGGVGNLWGTLLGGLGLGIANKLLEPWSGAVLAKILVLLFIILFIQKRPKGLFPQKGRAAT
jgi:urea transport system permease protein